MVAIWRAKVGTVYPNFISLAMSITNCAFWDAKWAWRSLLSPN